MSVYDGVARELWKRHQLGIERYGRELGPFSGLDLVRESLEECLDACVYLKGLQAELGALGMELASLLPGEDMKRLKERYKFLQ